MSQRPSKDEYYLDIARQVAKRGTCLSAEGGAIIVKDDQIISTGYIGAPRKTKDCIEKGYCLRRKLKIPSGHRYEICSSVHAEQNAIVNAARSGVSLLNGDMFFYVAKKTAEGVKPANAYPCYICKKIIINAGIKRFISNQEDGRFKIYDVQKWSEEWQERDMIEDPEKHDLKYEFK